MVENRHHFLGCPQHQRINYFLYLTPPLKQLFQMHNINPDIRCAILVLTNPMSTLLLDNITKQTKYLIINQQKYGIDFLFFDFFSSTWVHHQEQYLLHMRHATSKNQAVVGITAISIEIKKFTHNL